MTVKILVFAGSLRKGAYSGKVADIAAKQLAFLEAEVTHISLADYPLPLMDQNHELEFGVPEAAQRLAAMIVGHDGLLIATPEYNASVPPLLKNAIDWVSRVTVDQKGQAIRAFRRKATALCSSSDGNYAGIRAINHLRTIMVQCQADVISPQCSVPRGAEAFDTDGNFKEPALQRSMSNVCRALLERAHNH